jgi:hypothetical protein
VLPPTPAPANPPAPTTAPSRPRATTKPATGGPTATPKPGTAATSAPTLTPVTSSSDDVFFTLASDWGSAFPGQDVNYVIALRNNKSGQSLRDVVVAITLPANLEITAKPASDRGDPEVAGNRVTLKLNEITAGQALEINIPTRIKKDVAVDTRIVAQAELIYTGLSTPVYSNIAPVLVVGQAAQPTTAPTSQQAALPTATAAASPTETATAAASPTETATVAPSPAPQASGSSGGQTGQGAQPAAPLPETSSGVPISGVLLLGLTLLTRTWRIHRAQSRI